MDKSKLSQFMAGDLECAAHQALGSCPKDSMERMRQASDALEWMSDIFDTIRDEARSGRPTGLSLSIIGRRADYGKYLADDFTNITDVWREEMERAINVAGIKRGGSDIVER